MIFSDGLTEAKDANEQAYETTRLSLVVFLSQTSLHSFSLIPGRFGTIKCPLMWAI
ncbi:hypothetical protein HYR99_04610 [Candidatus Poribacteria bacterium]|nr:hypothetical protein [Candidatus Poribacteria bacterium]